MTRVTAVELPEPRTLGLWQPEKKQSPAPRRTDDRRQTTDDGQPEKKQNPAFRKTDNRRWTTDDGQSETRRQILFVDVFMAIGFQPLAAFVFGHFLGTPFFQ